MNFQTKSQMPHPERSNSYLRWSHYFFSIVGILSLSYCGFVLLDARVYQAYQTRRFERALNSRRPSAESGEALHPSPVPPPPEVANRLRPASLGAIGRRSAPLGQIELSTIGLSAMILEGTDYWTLQRSVGHIPETALPGEAGNVVLAGHRDTFFRSLRKIQVGDLIRIKTPDGDFQYRVESTAVVPPSDIHVLDASGGHSLTLITCFPFNFVGSAPNRFVVRAREVGPPAQFTKP